jgi:hypothetical protein
MIKELRWIRLKRIFEEKELVGSLESGVGRKRISNNGTRMGTAEQ